MQDFQYHVPKSMDGIVRALREGPDAKVIAGGMSLLPLMKLGLAAPRTLVALDCLGPVVIVDEEGPTSPAVVKIDALCTHSHVAASEFVRKRIPALTAMAGGIGDPQVRNRGTIGGSLAHNDPAADYPAACLALGATVSTNRRSIAADDFFRGMFLTALEEDEVIVSVHFPEPKRAGWAKFPNPASKYAVAGVMVADGPAGVRVAVTGASGDGVFRAREMEEALASSFEPASLAGITVPAEGMLSDDAADAEYRAHLVTVMAKRAVEACG